MTRRLILLLFLALAGLSVLAASDSDAKSTADYEKIYQKLNEIKALTDTNAASTLALEKKYTGLAATESNDIAKLKAEIDAQRHTVDSILKEITNLNNHQTTPPSYIPILAAVTGGVTSAIIGGIFIFLIAKYITLYLKMVDNTLEFSKRFGDLLKEQSDLNKAYNSLSRPMTSAQIAIEREAAETWWWRFFDLMLYEYDFFRQGLIWDKRFAQWMRWRWYNFNDQTQAFQTSGITYRDGWNGWKSHHPNMNNRLVEFLDDIHALKDINEVYGVVNAKAPHWWRRYKLEE